MPLMWLFSSFVFIFLVLVFINMYFEGFYVYNLSMKSNKVNSSYLFEW